MSECLDRENSPGTKDEKNSNKSNEKMTWKGMPIKGDLHQMAGRMSVVPKWTTLLFAGVTALRGLWDSVIRLVEV